MSDVEVLSLLREEWELWRNVRLRALQESPHAFGSTYDREAAFTEADWTARLTGGPAVVALADGHPVGLGAGHRVAPGPLQIVAMWVDPGRRGHGVGRAILNHIAGWATERNLTTCLDVTLDNEPARRLYEAAGFQATGATRPLRPGSDQLVERMLRPAR